ncbi:MAG: hypothetical protein KF833_15755 [Verrucomicrobiae bacterium]|nr:hypothetical protein [Verrucomicrobiae bacterium]
MNLIHVQSLPEGGAVKSGGPGDGPGIQGKSIWGGWPRAVWRRVGAGAVLGGLLVASGWAGAASLGIRTVFQQYDLSISWVEDGEWGGVTRTSSSSGIIGAARTPGDSAAAGAWVGTGGMGISGYCAEVDGAGISAWAEGTWVFQPECPVLVLTLEGHYRYNYYAWEQTLEVSLWDITAGRSLVTYFGDNFEYGEVPPEVRFEVDPTHLYRFVLKGSMYAYASKDVDIEVRTTLRSVRPVPETASSLGLLILAMTVGCAVVRRGHQTPKAPSAPQRCEAR